MKHIALLVALLSVLVASACSSGSGGRGSTNFNTPRRPYEGPGCYDHKNRIERTVRTQSECEALTWVWKP